MTSSRTRDVGNVCLNVAAGSLVSGFLGATLQSDSVEVALATFLLSAGWFAGFVYIGLKLKGLSEWKD